MQLKFSSWDATAILDTGYELKKGADMQEQKDVISSQDITIAGQEVDVEIKSSCLYVIAENTTYIIQNLAHLLSIPDLEIKKQEIQKEIEEMKTHDSNNMQILREKTDESICDTIGNNYNIVDNIVYYTFPQELSGKYKYTRPSWSPLMEYDKSFKVLNKNFCANNEEVFYQYYPIGHKFWENANPENISALSDYYVYDRSSWKVVRWFNLLEGANIQDNNYTLLWNDFLKDSDGSVFIHHNNIESIDKENNTLPDINTFDTRTINKRFLWDWKENFLIRFWDVLNFKPFFWDGISPENITQEIQFIENISEEWKERDKYKIWDQYFIYDWVFTLKVIEE